MAMTHKGTHAQIPPHSPLNLGVEQMLYRPRWPVAGMRVPLNELFTHADGPPSQLCKGKAPVSHYGHVLKISRRGRQS